MFHVDPEEERDAWISAIESISQKLDKRAKEAESQEKEATAGKQKVSIDDFEMIKVLGRGTFGKVVVAREKKTREVVAIKILKKDVIIAKDEIAHTMTENRVLQQSKHPFLTVSI
jgi:RAC serine/threonine-protein kinase